MRVQATAHPRLVRGATNYSIIFEPSAITRDDDAPETWEADIETAGVMLRGDTPEVPGGTLIVEAYAGEDMVRSGSGSPGGMNITIGRDITEVRARLMVAGAQVAARSLVVEVNRKGEPGKDGEDGEDGEDAIGITLTPAQILLPLTGKATQTFFSVNATKGTKEVAIGGLLPVGTVIPVAGVAASISATPPGYVIRHDGKTPVNGYFEITVQIDGVDHKRRVQLGTYEVPTGPTGAVIRVTEWQPDTDYKDGETEETDADGKLTGIRYLDIATRDGNAWQCIRSHTSTPGNYGDGNPTGCPTSTMPDGKNTCWRQLSKTNPIYTPLLLADNARINFMSGQEIIIADGPDVWARLGTPSKNVIMWSGGPTVEDSTHRLYYNGISEWGRSKSDRIEVNPLKGHMVIYSDGAPASFFEGVEYDGPQGVRVSEVTHEVKEVSPLPSLSRSGGGASTEGDYKIGEFTLDTAGDVEVYVKVRLSAQSSRVGTTDPPQYPANAASAYIYFRRDGDQIGEESASAYLGNQRVDLKTAEETLRLASMGLLPGKWEVWVHFDITKGVVYTGSGTQNLAGSAGAAVTEIRAQTVVPEQFEAHYYANGFYAGQSGTDYVMGWRDGDNGMAFEAVNKSGHGIRVTSSGVAVMQEGAWRGIDDLIDARLKTLGLLT